MEVLHNANHLQQQRIIGINRLTDRIDRILKSQVSCRSFIEDHIFFSSFLLKRIDQYIGRDAVVQNTGNQEAEG